jgi:hypothetical protein
MEYQFRDVVGVVRMVVAVVDIAPPAKEFYEPQVIQISISPKQDDES